MTPRQVETLLALAFQANQQLAAMQTQLDRIEAAQT